MHAASRLVGQVHRRLLHPSGTALEQLRREEPRSSRLAEDLEHGHLATLWGVRHRPLGRLVEFRRLEAFPEGQDSHDGRRERQDVGSHSGRGNRVVLLLVRLPCPFKFEFEHCHSSKKIFDGRCYCSDSATYLCMQPQSTHHKPFC